MKQRKQCLVIAGACALMAAAGAVASADQRVGEQAGCPPVYPCKPAKTELKPWHRGDVISVKFNDGQMVRLRDGLLTDMGKGALAAPGAQAVLTKYGAGRWERMHTLDEAILDKMRETAEKNLGGPVADLNQYYFLYLPAGANAEQAIDDFNGLDAVELCDTVNVPPPLPVAPDFSAQQLYLQPATDGINARGVRLLTGGTGFNTWVVDCEYSWNTAHIDLPSTTLVTAAPNDPFADNNHGTAVLGEIHSRNNGVGTTGGAYGARSFIAAANTGAGGGTYNLANAITLGSNAIFAGDVILIEQQTFGPNYTGVPAGTQFGLVASEWDRPVYDAIRTAIGNNRVVVEAAGNGSQNLDVAASTGHANHWPFLAANDSGAIIVGASASPGGSSTDRSRLGFSCYGATVDLQGYGENVVTTGYGGLFSADGVNAWYTGSFGGTSSASPIVTSACAVISAIYLNYIGSTPTPAQVRTILRNTGTAQTSGGNPASQNIGPRPNLLAAAASIAPSPPNNLCALFTNVTAGQYIGSLLGATNDGAGPCGTSAGNPDVWYSFTAPNYPVTLIASTCGTHDFAGVDSGIDTVLAVFDTCGGTSLGCDDDGAGNCGSADGGVNRDSFVATNLAPGQTVRIRVSKFGGSSAGPFLLNISFAPSNNACANAINVGQGGTFNSSLVNATNDGTATCGISATNADVWYSYTAPAYPVFIEVDTCGTHDMGGVDAGMDTVVSAINGCGGTQIDCNDDWNVASLPPCTATDGGSPRDSSLRVAVGAAQSVRIRVSKFNVVASGPFVLHVRVVPANTACADAIAIGEGTFPFSNVNATTDGPNDCPVFVNQDIWYNYTAGCTGTATISTCASAYDSTLAVYGSTACPVASPPLVCNDDFGPACATSRASVTLAVVGGQAYKIRVGGFSTLTGAGTLTISCAGAAGGACCSGTTCSLLAAGACTGANTSFAGNGTVCNVPGNNTAPCCKADFNQSGAVSVQDIFDFLAAYFSGDLQADVNESGATSVQDIFDYLAIYFAGCP